MQSARGQEEVLVQHGVQCSTLYNYAEASEVRAGLLDCLMQSQAYYTGPCIKASTVLKQALTMFCSGKEAPKTAVDNQVSLQQICQRLNPESKQIQSSGLWSLKQDSISGGAEHIHVKKNLLYGECYLRWNRAGLEAKYTLEPKPYTHNTHKQMSKVHYYSRAVCRKDN